MRAILISFLALAACSSSKGGSMGGDNSGDIRQDYDDVAMSIGTNASRGELGANLDLVTIALGQIPSGFTQASAGEVTGTRGGLTFDYRYYCRPVDELMDIPCDGHEHHLHAKVAVSGSVAAGTMSMDNLDRTASWTVRDIQVQKPRVDGHGTTTFVSNTPTGTYMISYDDVYTRVRYAETPTVPSAGTIDLTLTITRSRDGNDRDFTAMAQIAFTGPDAATITLDGTEVYNLQMSTGTVVRAN